MPHYYSAKTFQFYDSDIIGEANIPTDAVAVSDADYAALYLAQRNGAAIKASASGAPEAVSEYGAGSVIDLATVTESSSYFPKKTLAEQASDALAIARTTVMNDFYLVNQPIPQAWVDYQVALRAIADGKDTTSTALPTKPSASTSYTLTGAVTATAGAAVTLTVTPDNSGPASATTVTLSDGDAGGTFSSATVTLAAWDATAQTVTYTPKAAGTVSISATNGGGLINPVALSVVVSATG